MPGQRQQPVRIAPPIRPPIRISPPTQLPQVKEEETEKVDTSQSVESVLKYFDGDTLADVKFQERKKITKENLSEKEFKALIAEVSGHFSCVGELMATIKSKSDTIRDCIEIFCTGVLEKIKSPDGLTQEDLGALIKTLVSARKGSTEIYGDHLKKLENEIGAIKTKHNKICGFKLDNQDK
jgi:hypothetical protein